MNDWAAEWAAFNVGVERSRAQYDANPITLRHGGFRRSITWPLASVQYLHNQAFAAAKAARQASQDLHACLHCVAEKLRDNEQRKGSAAGFGPDDAPPRNVTARQQ